MIDLMINKIYKLVLVLSVFLYGYTVNAQRIGRYDVLWNTPSHNSSGSMPIGNGETGINFWIEEDGDLMMFLSRTDTWSEAGRLLKLCKVRLSISPNPFLKGTKFSQRLNLREGCINIIAGTRKNEVKLTVFVDANNPVVYVTGSSSHYVSVKVSAEPWRTRAYNVTKEEKGIGIGSAWSLFQAPDSIGCIESADKLLNEDKAIGMYHRNDYSSYNLSLRCLDLESLKSKFTDPLVNRTFGFYIDGKGFRKESPITLVTSKPLKKFSVKLTTHTNQTATEKHFVAEIAKISRNTPEASAALAATQSWWKKYWDKSWIIVSTPDTVTGFHITQSYLLQQFVTACGGRGSFPINFNGSIFTVDPQFTNPNINSNPDFRMWGGEYWWQNTRLMYYPMLQTGDFEMMRSLFRHYLNRLPTFKVLANEYYNVNGAIMPETSTIFGTYGIFDYGWNRKGMAKGEIQNLYVKQIWSPILELSSLMIDYYNYTKDREFVRQELIPIANEALTFFDTKFPKNDKGNIQIRPTQVLETYWYEVLNDMPTVAGLHAVVEGLLSLPMDLSSNKDRDFWIALKKALPLIPTEQKNGFKVFAPAEKYKPSSSNFEIPELYNVFPFHLSNLSTSDISLAINTYKERTQKGDNCWTQDGQVSAMLGLTNEAVANLLAKVKNSNPNFRFPAYWGPNNDWTPDQDHGGNLMTTLQTMVVQNYGCQVYVLPSFPKDWGVDFRLFVSDNNQIEGCYKNGIWERSPTLKEK